MGLESSTPGYISDLDKTWPLFTDPRSQGDDHLRYIKSVLKNTFPGALGQGFNAPILVDETELNFLQGVTSNVQAQLDAANTRPLCIVDRGSVNYAGLVANTPLKIPFTDVIFDSHSGWDAVNFWYTVPINGIYRVTAQSGTIAVNSVTRVTMTVLNNTTPMARSSGQDVASALLPVGRVTACLIATAGDRLFSQITLSGGNGTGTGNVASTFMDIEFVRPL
jgi:hypothetical protein